MKVYLYVLDSLADWEISYLTAEIYSKRYLDKTKSDIELIKVGNTLNQIKTMGGINIKPDITINDIKFKEGDLLILPGANTWLEKTNKKIIDIVSEIINKKIIVAAICGATFALAKKGLLNNRKHTSNDKEFLKRICPEYLGEKYYSNKTVVVDGNLITASGIAHLEFSYEIFKKTNLMKSETLEAWHNLYKTKKSIFFNKLY